MNQGLKCMLLLAAVIFSYGCQSAKTESSYAVPEKTQSSTYRKDDITLITQERNLRMRAERFAIGSVPSNDSVILTTVDTTIQGTNRKFDIVQVQRGQQYNVLLPGNARAFINAATLFFGNFSSPHKYYIVQGKAWLQTSSDSAIIKADDFIIHLAPNSTLNIDNYFNDPNIIISLIEGDVTITRDAKKIILTSGTELWMERASGKIKTKISPEDLTKWTTGSFRQHDVDISYQMREIGRLYDKDIFISDDLNKQALEVLIPINFEYRHFTEEQVVELFKSLIPIKLELIGDSLKLSKR